jgi:hypothetical protein
MNVILSVGGKALFNHYILETDHPAWPRIVYVRFDIGFGIVEFFGDMNLKEISLSGTVKEAVKEKVKEYEDGIAG